MGVNTMIGGVVFGVMALDQVELACDRERCVVTHSVPASRVETPLAGYRAAQSRTEGSGGSRRIYLTLIADSGARHDLMPVHYSMVGALAVELQALLAGERETVQHREPRPPMTFLPGVLALGLGGYVLFHGIRNRRRARVSH